MIGNGNTVYLNGVDPELVGSILNDYTDVTDKFTLQPGWTYKTGNILYNYNTRFLFLNISAYRSNQLTSAFEDVYKFNDPHFKYKNEFTPPFAQSLGSGGGSNEGIAQFGFSNVNTVNMGLCARKIYGSVYGLAFRGLMLFDYE